MPMSIRLEEVDLIMRRVKEYIDLRLDEIKPAEVLPVEQGGTGVSAISELKDELGILELGIEGPAGPRGIQGPKGDKGDKGDVGDTGPIGPTGSQGPNGATGARGEIGPQGPKGDKGDQGIQGPIGPQGVKGDTGAKGATGNTGATGPQGAVGPAFSGSAGSTQLPVYVSGGAPIAITRANLRIGVFGSTAIGNRSMPVYIAANGVPTAINAGDVNSLGIGTDALKVNTASSNTAIGLYALAKTTTGGDNTALGHEALLNNTTGNCNTAVGVYALKPNTSTHGTAIGYDALGSNTTGRSNTAVGVSALSGITTGVENTAIGYQTMYTGNYSYTTSLGSYAMVTGNNQVQLGASGTTTYAYGAIQNRSDVRDKANVKDIEYRYRDFINGLRAVTFQWDYREDYRDNSDSENPDMRKLSEITHDGTHIRSRRHSGFIAQEVKALADSLGFDFSGYQDHSINGGDDVLSLGYEAFIPPLVATVQGQDKEIKELKSEITELRALVNQLFAK